jgi:hypothetical protein
VTTDTASPPPHRESGLSRFAARYRAFTQVDERGLPRLRVLAAFLILLAVVGIVLIASSVNGTSSGAYYSSVHAGKDPQLLIGKPEQIRSDEWNVGAPWIISQVQQGLPSRSDAFPGGADADLPFGLPDRTTATIMEPQNWGFLFLDVNRGYAWKWWIPGLAMIGASFAMMLTLLPRRPLVAAGLAIGFFYSPFFQWWYEPSAQWPVVWGAVTITAIVWALRSTRLRERIVPAVIVAFFTAVMAAGIYAPFIIPVVYVVLFFGIGQLVWQRRTGTRWPTLVIRLVPIGAAGLIGGGAVLLWLHSKASVVAQFLGTVYPGQRLTSTGTRDYLSIARTFGASFSQSLQNANGFLGINSSEASSFFLLGVFLLPAGVWVAVRRRRRRETLPWTTLGLLAFLVLIAAFILVPGWNPIAHLLFLDLTNGTRMRIGIGFASFILIGSIARDLDVENEHGEGGRAPRLLAWLSVAAFAIIQLALAGAIFIVQGNARLWGGSPLWLVFAAMSGAAIYLFIRRRPLWGTGLFLIITVASSVTVNPLYAGVFDLRTTAVSRAVVNLDHADAKLWVGVGGTLSSSVLLESGVTAYNGTQGFPTPLMWKRIDPAGRYSNEWNRLGAVIWTSGHGEPVVTNPAADVISVTFDACSAFAQKNVGYVLSSSALRSPCLVPESTFALPHSKKLSIYRVAPRSVPAG